MVYLFAISPAISLLLIGVLSEDARVEFQFQDEIEDGWRVKGTFSKPVKSFLVWRASVQTISEDKRTFILKNKTWNSEKQAGRLFQEENETC